MLCMVILVPPLFGGRIIYNPIRYENIDSWSPGQKRRSATREDPQNDMIPGLLRQVLVTAIHLPEWIFKRFKMSEPWKIIFLSLPYWGAW